MQRQLRVWEALLEIRILLQKPLNACHRLPQAALHPHVQVPSRARRWFSLP